MLSDDESDREVMQRFAPLSRSIQDFIAEFLGESAAVTCAAELLVPAFFGVVSVKPTVAVCQRGRCTHNSANVAALTEEWLCGTFSLCAQKAGGQKLPSMQLGARL